MLRYGLGPILTFVGLIAWASFGLFGGNVFAQESPGCPEGEIIINIETGECGVYQEVMAIDEPNLPEGCSYIDGAGTPAMSCNYPYITPVSESVDIVESELPVVSEEVSEPYVEEYAPAPVVVSLPSTGVGSGR